MTVEWHEELVEDLAEEKRSRPGWPGPHPIDPDTGNPIVGEVPFPEPWGKRYTPPSSTRRRLSRPSRSASGNLGHRDPLSPADLTRLHDERGNPVGLVDPEDGALFTLAGNPSRPTLPRARGGFWINRRHTRARRAADAAGVTRDPRVAAWEHAQLELIDDGRTANALQAAIERVATGLRRAN